MEEPWGGFCKTPNVGCMSRDRHRNRVRIDPAQTAVLPLAFDRVPLDQPQVQQARPEQAGMYLPISLGSIVAIVLVVWLLGVVLTNQPRQPGRGSLFS